MENLLGNADQNRRFCKSVCTPTFGERLCGFLGVFSSLSSFCRSWPSPFSRLPLVPVCVFLLAGAWCACPVSPPAQASIVTGPRPLFPTPTFSFSLRSVSHGLRLSRAFRWLATRGPQRFARGGPKIPTIKASTDVPKATERHPLMPPRPPKTPPKASHPPHPSLPTPTPLPSRKATQRPLRGTQNTKDPPSPAQRKTAKKDGFCL